MIYQRKSDEQTKEEEEMRRKLQEEEEEGQKVKKSAPIKRITNKIKKEASVMTPPPGRPNSQSAWPPAHPRPCEGVAHIVAKRRSPLPAACASARPVRSRNRRDVEPSDFPEFGK